MAALMAATLVVTTTPVMAQESDLDTLGAALVNEFIHIVTKPDEEKRADLTEFLAEEFQIVAPTTVAWTRPSIFWTPRRSPRPRSRTSTPPRLAACSSSATRSRSTRRSMASSRPPWRRACQYSTRAEGGAWQIAAHANFGALPQPE
jgi:hypothetical protein